MTYCRRNPYMSNFYNPIENCPIMMVGNMGCPWSQIQRCGGRPGPRGATGPTGSTGPTGPSGSVSAILGSYDTLAELIAAHPTGNPGDGYLVNGALYVWDGTTNSWRSVANLVGPTGPTGPTGSVSAILGSYDTLAELIAAHPTGNPGDGYLVNGVLYVWDGTISNWRSVANLVGPTGSTGETGAVGSVSAILDSYDTLAELVAAHPTGNPGDGYLVDGELYVWDDATNSWTSVADLVGPTGPTGPTGSVSAILGSYDTLADLIAAHPTGNPGDGYLVDGELYIWDDGIGNWVSIANLVGPTGATGAVSAILGSYDTLADLITAHPTGNPGDGYLVDGELYIWDDGIGNWVSIANLVGPTGATGATGPVGSLDYAYSIVPFSSQAAPTTHSTNGIPTRVSLLGFGYGDGRGNVTVVDDFSIPIDSSDGSFSLGLADNGNTQVVFSLPFDMKLRSIYLTTGTWATFTFPSTVYPYVQLYTASATSNTFMPLLGAAAEPETGIGPGTIQGSTMWAASVNDLEIQLQAGTRIAIGALMRTESNTPIADEAYYLYFTGGIGFTPWVEIE